MQLSLHQLLFRAFHGQNNILQPVREELGLGRGQPKILTYLLDFGESSQNDIASYFQTDPAAVSRMTETLRQNGFLTRTEDASCRRANRLALTEKGREAALIWRRRCSDVESIILAGFSTEEAEMLKGYLRRIIANFAGAGNG